MFLRCLHVIFVQDQSALNLLQQIDILIGYSLQSSLLPCLKALTTAARKCDKKTVAAPSSCTFVFHEWGFSK